VRPQAACRSGKATRRSQARWRVADPADASYRAWGFPGSLFDRRREGKGGRHARHFRTRACLDHHKPQLPKGDRGCRGQSSRQVGARFRQKNVFRRVGTAPFAWSRDRRPYRSIRHWQHECPCADDSHGMEGVRGRLGGRFCTLEGATAAFPPTGRRLSGAAVDRGIPSALRC
jgi:hypothetical protein